MAIATISELQPSINRTAFILVGMYLFAAAYSPGEGPVPFVSASLISKGLSNDNAIQVYASESFPQETRDLGESERQSNSKNLQAWGARIELHGLTSVYQGWESSPQSIGSLTLLSLFRFLL